MSKTYTTIQGDMWDLIAFKVYGREVCMAELLAANETYRHTAIFPAGIKLTLPEIDLPKASTLPPWKR